MLIRLETENFKSYHGRQVLGPFKEFTAVIGPNGSGKSNLMDAVSFVFGVRAQHLRSSVLKNLIYGAGTSRAAKRASVLAVFQPPDQETEIRFLRTIKPDGGCEYKIDDEYATQEKYLDRLDQLNILSKAKNFLVFQGDVEKIAQKSPKELCQFIEQISGSADLKEDYDNALLAKEMAEEEVRDNLQKRRGIKTEKKQYMDQKEEAEKFQKLTSQKDKITLDHTLFQLCQVKHQIDSREEEEETAKAELQDERRFLEQVEKQVRDKRKEQARDHKKYVLLDDQVKKKGTELKKLNPDRVKLEEQIDHAHKKVETDRKQLEKIEHQHAKHEKSLARLQKDLEELHERRQAWEDAASQQDAGRDLQLQQAQLDQYNRLKEVAAREATEIQEELGKSDRSLSEMRNAVEREQVKIEELQKGLDNEKSRQAQWVERVAATEEKLKENERKLADYKKQRQEKMQSDTKEAQQADYFQRELDKLNNQLREAKADRHESERERRMNETIDSLRSMFPGAIKGRMVDLCTPINRKYNTAISVALGQNADAIVVDTDGTAKSCLNYLREQKVGVATFVPLSGIQTKPVNERLRQLGGSKKLVIDVVQYDKAFEKAMEYALGNTIVCDTMEEARQLCYGRDERYKCVTVDGVLISKNGNMTGGSTGNEGHANRWEEKAVNELKRQRDKLQKEATDLHRLRFPRQQELQTLDGQIAGLESEREITKRELKTCKERLAQANKTIEQYERQLAGLDVAKLEMELARRQKAHEEIQKRKDSIDDRVFRDFCVSIGIANIREYEGKELQAAKERQRLSVEFSNQETRLKSQISYERSRDYTGDIRRWKKSLDEAEQLLREATQQKEAIEEKAKAINEEIEKLMVEQKEVKALVDDWETQLKELKREEQNRLKKVAAAEKKATTLETELDQLRGKRHSLLRACRVEEIPIPLMEGSLDDLDAELGSQGDAMDLDSLETQDRSVLHQKEASVQIDFSGLKEELREPLSPEDIESIDQQYLDRLKKLQTQIDTMAPNMRAMERLGTVRARLKAAEEDFEAVRARAQAADKKFREVQKKRFELFNTCYQHVSKAIDSIYKDLTKNPDPNSILPGGTAYLTLENQEEPYLYGVEYNTMPPSKRFRSMEQLSGGEKTVAALALLFAIHSFRPAPFFVLDEVDAALDAVNVAKVANYIKEKSSECQCLVISLKDTFFHKSDAIMGVYRDHSEECSHTVTLDMEQFDTPAAR
eukprot:comp23649_c1_seq1/m.40372 comp23649_c1_seq1/g.40372  ORF comp23649_c1_seq1/g.40372 comp23649_c1_seq1/m.40372 type:complete len:1229 (-) comp23649_c1_seq1:37-3723(-)